METTQNQHLDSANLPVTITVNEHEVTVDGPRTSGFQIKLAAIAQGVKIEAAFLLSEEMENRRTRIVGDQDVITVNKHSRFVAVAPDDPS